MGTSQEDFSQWQKPSFCDAIWNANIFLQRTICFLESPGLRSKEMFKKNTELYRTFTCNRMCIRLTIPVFFLFFFKLTSIYYENYCNIGQSNRTVLTDCLNRKYFGNFVACNYQLLFINTDMVNFPHYRCSINDFHT